MSGHSKWSTIKRKKGAEDAKRGKIFTRLIKEISIAARDGGGSAETNPRLRSAIASAKSANMPKDNIERAIKKGTGELPGVSYEEHIYEGYGPDGVSMIIEILTDNKNRAVAEVRHILSRHDSNLGSSGCVSWNFEKKGIIAVKDGGLTEDDMIEKALEAGADDVNTVDDGFEIETSPEDLHKVREALEADGVSIISADISMIPKTLKTLDRGNGLKTLRLIDMLEENDDVQNVYSNFDLSDEIFEEFANQQ